MKKLLPLLFVVLFAGVSQAQSITHAHFVLNSRADGFRSIELELDGQYLVRITGNGEILYADEQIPLTYYDKFDIHDIEGRVKSIGDASVAYNNTFDIHAVKGTLKAIGDIPIKYFDAFDINDPRGKVKSVGSISIHYHHGRISSMDGNTDRVSVSQKRK